MLQALLDSLLHTRLELVAPSWQGPTGSQSPTSPKPSLKCSLRKRLDILSFCDRLFTGSLISCQLPVGDGGCHDHAPAIATAVYSTRPELTHSGGFEAGEPISPNCNPSSTRKIFPGMRVRSTSSLRGNGEVSCQSSPARLWHFTHVAINYAPRILAHHVGHASEVSHRPT